MVVRGLAITLVKADGTVYGPCRYCRGEVELVCGGQLSKSIEVPTSSSGRRRVVFVIDSEDS